MCLGSHRVGINNQNSDSGIPSDLRTCVNGNRPVFFFLSLQFNKFIVVLVLCVKLFDVWQRSVISAHHFHATRRVLCSVWMAKPHSHVCVNLAGRGHAAKMVSSRVSVLI